MSLVKRKRVDGTEYPHWYARYKNDVGKWTWKKFFTDKRASERAWEEFNTQLEQRIAGVRTVAMEQASRPIAEHVEEYIASLADDKRLGAETIRLARWQLETMIEQAGMKRLADLNLDRVCAFVGAVKRATPSTGKPAAHSYVNKFISRAKAFANWLLGRERIAVFPLGGLEKLPEDEGPQPRKRRALTDEELGKLLALPKADRAFVYKFLALSGLRRGEAERLRCEQIVLDTPQPFMRLEKHGKTYGEDIVLHPELVDGLRELVCGKMPTAQVFRSIPEVETLEGDLRAVGVEFKTAAGRADIHAMRHTMATRTVRAESNAIKAAQLTRHRDLRVLTKRYTHLSMVDMADTLSKVTVPTVASGAMAATGTLGKIGPNGHESLSHAVSHGTRAKSRLNAQTCTTRKQSGGSGVDTEDVGILGKTAQNEVESGDELTGWAPSDNVVEMRPSTQVD